MRKFFLITTFLFFSATLIAQDFPSERYHRGRVILQNYDSIVGNIKYDLSNDLIQIMVDTVMHTYSSRKIMFFEIVDEEWEQFRYFFSLPYRVKPNYMVPMLFEVMQEGPVTLLAREYITYETNNSLMGSYYYGMPTTMTSMKKLTYDFFFLDLEGEIVQFEEKKKQLLEIMSKQADLVAAFMLENKLHVSNRQDLIKITAYYNSLEEHDE